MRILHVGFGFRPWIVNGLVIYCEDLMAGQVQAGHDVRYFFAGRRLPALRRPFLHRWRRDGVRMYEWCNSDLVVGRHRGTPNPESDLAHASTERALRRVLSAARPEVVHVHDLGGLPSSVLEIATASGAAVVMTVHDYFALCPTVKLYDAEDRICLRREPGEMCAVCCADAPSDNREDLERTVWYLRMRVRTGVPGLERALRRPALERIGSGLIGLSDRLVSAAAPVSAPPEPAPQAPGRHALDRVPHAPGRDYQRRRDVNVARLSAVDALLVYSTRSANICRELGVDPDRMRRVRINPSHIETLRPKQDLTPGNPVRFGVLNACNTTQKGADLVIETLQELSRRGLDDRFRFSVRGWIAPHVLALLQGHPSVTLDGSYSTEQLDEVLETLDVGLVPSIWEEVYGFVGLEFLAKGIPVIGNALGGIPEYVREGETGWLNHSASATEMADLMQAIIEDPPRAEALGRRALTLHDQLVRPMAEQVAEAEVIYREVLRRSSARAPEHAA